MTQSPHDPQDPPTGGRPILGPPELEEAPAAFPFAVVTRGVTTIEQLLGELVRLDRHPGARYPVLIDFPRCKHTVIFAVPRIALTGTSYGERQVALWSRGCPMCKQAPLGAPTPAADPFDEGVRAGMDAVMARIQAGGSTRG